MALPSIWASNSVFWNGIIQTTQSLKRGLAVKVNNRRNSLFWDDIWASDIPLRLEFLNLYVIDDDKHCLVVDCWAGDGWEWVLGDLWDRMRWGNGRG